MFKDNDVKGRIRLLVETESLFNDGAAAVLFVMALAWTQASASSDTTLQTLETLSRVVLGGVAIGAVCGGGAILVAQRTSEHLIEAALTTVAAYGSFLLAEYFHVSGVLAAVTAGLVMGNLGVLSEQDGGVFSSRGRDFVLGFWEFAAFLANSAIFLLIGTNVAVMPFQSYGAGVLAASIAIVLAGRALTVFPLSLLFYGSRWKISFGEQLVLWWGGLRGALALALSLSLPPTMPLRDEIVVVTFGVVAFSIIAQGLSMPWLLRRLGFLPPAA
jgi:CPA1 family monovalent cation:H+ antiporter